MRNIGTASWLTAAVCLFAAPIMAQAPPPHAAESGYVVDLVMSIGDQRNIQGRVSAGQAIRVALAEEGKAFGIVPLVVDFGTPSVELVVYALDPTRVEAGDLGRELERLRVNTGQNGTFSSIPDAKVTVTGFAQVRPLDAPGFRLISNVTVPPVPGVSPCCVTCGNVTTCACGVKMDCDSCCDIPSCCIQQTSAPALYRPAIPGIKAACQQTIASGISVIGKKN